MEAQETHFELATAAADPGAGVNDWRLRTGRAPAVGFILSKYTNNDDFRENLHPAYRDLPYLQQPLLGPLPANTFPPPKPDLLRQVDDALYLAFVRDICRSWRIIRSLAYASMIVLCCGVILPFLLLESCGELDQLGLPAAVLSAFIVVLFCCKCCFPTPPGKVAELYQDLFREHGIRVEYVKYERYPGTKQPWESEYIVFSEVMPVHMSNNRLVADVVPGRETRYPPAKFSTNALENGV